MDTNQRLTWAEIVTRYPNQWVIIAEPEEGIGLSIQSGVVFSDAPDKKQLIANALAHPLTIPHPHLIRFTGIIPHPEHVWRLVTILNEIPTKS